MDALIVKHNCQKFVVVYDSFNHDPDEIVEQIRYDVMLSKKVLKDVVENLYQKGLITSYCYADKETYEV